MSSETDIPGPISVETPASPGISGPTLVEYLENPSTHEQSLKIVSGWCSGANLRREDAEDIVQGALMRAYLGKDSFRGEAKMSTWLHKVLYHEFLNHLRAVRKARRVLSFDPAQLVDVQMNILNDGRGDSGLTEDELESLVYEALSGLPDDQSQVIRLQILEGKTYKEIVAILRPEETTVTIGAVRGRIYRARTFLKEVLQKLLGDH